MDGKYVLTGGEDDLVQVWSMEDRKIVAWGEGHNSWVSFSPINGMSSYYSFENHDGHFYFMGRVAGQWSSFRFILVIT